MRASSFTLSRTTEGTSGMESMNASSSLRSVSGTPISDRSHVIDHHGVSCLKVPGVSPVRHMRSATGAWPPARVSGRLPPLARQEHGIGPLLQLFRHRGWQKSLRTYVFLAVEEIDGVGVYLPCHPVGKPVYLRLEQPDDPGFCNHLPVIPPTGTQSAHHLHQVVIRPLLLGKRVQITGGEDTPYLPDIRFSKFTLEGLTKFVFIDLLHYYFKTPATTHFLQQFHGIQIP